MATEPRGRTVATATQLLAEQFSESSTHLGRVLADLGDDEFFWEPCDGCWTVHHRTEPSRAAWADGSGEWVIDYELPEPDPAPLTTIAWRTVHIAAVDWMYWEYAFGPGVRTFPNLEIPGGSAGAAVEWLAASQQPLLQELRGLDDQALDVKRPTNWGEEWPTRELFKVLIREQVHHGAEISLLRDLYRNRQTLRCEE